MRQRLLKTLSWLLGLNQRKFLELLGWPIRLKVPIVVVYDGLEELGRLSIGTDTAAEIQKFYRRTCGIELHTTVAGHPSAPWPNYPQEALLAHRFQHRGQPFLVLLRSDAARVGPGYLGQAFGETGGFCVVAAGAVDSNNNFLADEIAIHELGHLFGLDHEDGTFMRATLETKNRLVIKEQRVKVRETAYHFGGL